VWFMSNKKYWHWWVIVWSSTNCNCNISTENSGSSHLSWPLGRHGGQINKLNYLAQVKIYIVSAILPLPAGKEINKTLIIKSNLYKITLLLNSLKCFIFVGAISKFVKQMVLKWLLSHIYVKCKWECFLCSRMSFKNIVIQQNYLEKNSLIIMS